MKNLFTSVTSLLLAAGLAFADHHKKPVALEGVWNSVAETDNGEREFTITVAKKGDELTGVSHSVESGDDRTIDRISVEKKKVTIEFDMERDGQNAVIKIVADEKAAGKLEGKWSVEGADGEVLMSGPWRADKEVKFSVAGEWDSVGTTEDGEEHPSKLIISESGADLSGEFVGEEGTLKIDTVKLEGKELHLAFILNLEGNEVPTAVEAVATDENTLKGKWIIQDDSDEIVATGGWTAKRMVKPVFKLTGNWDVMAALPDDAEYKGTLSLKKDGDKLAGESKGADGEARKLKTATFDGKKLVYTVGIEMNGQEGTITVTATKENEDSFKGRWTLTSSDGEEVASDTWQATRGKAGE